VEDIILERKLSVLERKSFNRSQQKGDAPKLGLRFFNKFDLMPV